MDREEPYSSVSNRIRVLKESRRYEEAEEEIRREMEKNPDHLFLKVSLADLYLRQGRPNEGRILAEEVLSQDPQHPQALSILGDLFLKQHSPREALQCYRQAFNREPKSYLTLKTARALKEMGKSDEALEELERVLVVKPETLPFLKEKAVILNRMKKFDQALKIFEKIKELSPDDAFVRKEVLRLRSRTREETQVLKELQAVVSMDSRRDDAQIHGLYAQRLKDAGQIREAAVEYGKAATLEPQNLYFLKQQGFCLYHLKKYEEAIECFSEPFQRDPSDYAVRSALEKSCEAQGNLKGFLDLLEETCRQHPEQKSLLGMIKKIRKKLGPTYPGGA